MPINTVVQSYAAAFNHEGVRINSKVELSATIAESAQTQSSIDCKMMRLFRANPYIGRWTKPKGQQN